MHLDKYQVNNDNLEQLVELLTQLTGKTINLLPVNNGVCHEILVFTQVQGSLNKTDLAAIAEIFQQSKTLEISKFIFFGAQAVAQKAEFFRIVSNHYRVKTIWCCNEAALAANFEEIQPLNRAPISGGLVSNRRQFIYKPETARPVSKYYQPYKNIQLPGVNEDLSVLSSLDDGSCFFHSILYAITPNYNRLAPHEQQESVCKFRTSLAQNITPEIFAALGNGHTAELLLSIHKAHHPTNAVPDNQLLEQVRLNYIRTLRDPRQYAGEEYIDLVYRFFKIGILILTPGPNGEPTIYHWGEPDNYYEECKKFVVLWYDRHHYDVVVTPTQSSFECGHPVVEWFAEK